MLSMHRHEAKVAGERFWLKSLGLQLAATKRSATRTEWLLSCCCARYFDTGASMASAGLDLACASDTLQFADMLLGVRPGICNQNRTCPDATAELSIVVHPKAIITTCSDG